MTDKKDISKNENDKKDKEYDWLSPGSKALIEEAQQAIKSSEEADKKIRKLLFL